MNYKEHVKQLKPNLSRKAKIYTDNKSYLCINSENNLDLIAGFYYCVSNDLKVIYHLGDLFIYPKI